jgi:hypothetical protein
VKDNKWVTPGIFFGIFSALLAFLFVSTVAVFPKQSLAAQQFPHLVENELLNLAAQLKAMDMAKSGYFAHVSPQGITPWYWFEKVGYKYTYAGENLVVNFTTPDEVISALLNSPSHRANLLSNTYTETGIGVARGMYGGEEVIFLVQLFGTPASPMLTYQEVKPMSDLVALATRESFFATLRKSGILF